MSALPTSLIVQDVQGAFWSRVGTPSSPPPAAPYSVLSGSTNALQLMPLPFRPEDLPTGTTLPDALAADQLVRLCLATNLTLCVQASAINNYLVVARYATPFTAWRTFAWQLLPLPSLSTLSASLLAAGGVPLSLRYAVAARAYLVGAPLAQGAAAALGEGGLATTRYGALQLRRGSLATLSIYFSPLAASGTPPSRIVTIMPTTPSHHLIEHPRLSGGACPPGQFQPNSTSTVCLPCRAGTFLNRNTSFPAACTLCPAGSASEPGAAACTLCAANSYAVGAGSAQCAPCPMGLESLPGATACSPSCGKHAACVNLGHHARDCDLRLHFRGATHPPPTSPHPTPHRRAVELRFMHLGADVRLVSVERALQHRQLARPAHRQYHLRRRSLGLDQLRLPHAATAALHLRCVPITAEDPTAPLFTSSQAELNRMRICNRDH